MNYMEAIVLIIRERALLINNNKYDCNVSYESEDEIGKSVRSKSVNSKISVSL